MTPKMWKTYLVVAIFIFIFPFIESKRKASDSVNDCRRTNKEAFRYCTKSCQSDRNCRSNQKCLCDGDCGMSCVRNNVQCETPPKAKNSRQTVSNGRLFNSVVTYTCNSPYKLRGSAKRTCRAIGEWDGKKARCKIMCKDPGEITYGNRQVDGLQAGKYIKYWCIGDAYKLVGSAILKCLDTGEWDNPAPKCELPKCNPPKIPDSATVYWPRRMPKKFKFSDRVLLKCKEGYFKSKGGFLKCNGPDNWSGDITCSPKSCGSPGDISHGRVIGYVYSFKERVKYVCDEGYKLKGPAYRICQANEEWGGSQPVCEVVNCGPLNKPDHGDIIEQVALTFDNRIVFECNEKGYEMKGSRVRTCQSNGNWSGTPTTCELVQCGDPGKPANGQQKVSKGFVYGGSVTFTCDRDYTLKGTSTMYCQENKQWTASVPQCLAPCPDPGQPHQGNRIGNDFHHDKTVTFTCPKDYVMVGVRMIKCANGRWSNTKPSCKACGRPLGMDDKRIKDKQISEPQSTIQSLLSKIMTTIQVSSTSWARLNGRYGWCANRFFLFSTTFIQVDFHKTTRITAIETQGSEYHKSWVTQYSLNYKQSGNKFVWYKESHGQKIFQGNDDANGIVRHKLQKPIISRALRVVPSGYIVWPCLRVELYGCKV